MDSKNFIEEQQEKAIELVFDTSTDNEVFEAVDDMEYEYTTRDELRQIVASTIKATAEKFNALKGHPYTKSEKITTLYNNLISQAKEKK